MSGGEFVCRAVRNGHLAPDSKPSDRLEQILAALHVLWIFERKRYQMSFTNFKLEVKVTQTATSKTVVHKSSYVEVRSLFTSSQPWDRQKFRSLFPLKTNISRKK